jgi:hypothetical protein
MLRLGKKGVSIQYSDLIISAADHFEIMVYISFNAELQGLQNHVKFFLAIDF